MPTSAATHSLTLPSQRSEKTAILSEGRTSRMARFSRYYQTPTPVANRFLALKWDEKQYFAHRTEIRKAKSKIDNSPPLTFVHLQLNLKKLENEEFRLCDMENENRVLLEKMSYVFRTPPLVDTIRDTRFDVIRSLGKVKMQREFIRITAENHAILKRILTQQPNYLRKKFLLEFRWHQKIMSLNSKYPITWDHNQMPQYVPPEVPDTRYLQTMLTPLKKRRDYRRTKPGELPLDCNGYPFPQFEQRLKMALKKSWRPKDMPRGSRGSSVATAAGSGSTRRRSSGSPRRSSGSKRSARSSGSAAKSSEEDEVTTQLETVNEEEGAAETTKDVPQASDSHVEEDNVADTSTDVFHADISDSDVEEDNVAATSTYVLQVDTSPDVLQPETSADVLQSELSKSDVEAEEVDTATPAVQSSAVLSEDRSRPTLQVTETESTLDAGETTPETTPDIDDESPDDETPPPRSV